MVNTKDNNFTPTVALSPGITIKENMRHLGLTQKELAAKLGITEQNLSHILNADSPITHEIALKLEAAMGPSAKFWENLETNYQVNKTRLEQNGLKID